jgi:hypothetical protein
MQFGGFEVSELREVQNQNFLNGMFFATQMVILFLIIFSFTFF